MANNFVLLRLISLLLMCPKHTQLNTLKLTAIDWLEMAQKVIYTLIFLYCNIEVLTLKRVMLTFTLFVLYAICSYRSGCKSGLGAVMGGMRDK